jgi:hypothetical protein
MWFDAADRTSMTFSGSTVTQWNDKSGNGRNATNGAYAAPTYSATGFNGGYPGLLFNASSTMLNTAALLPTPVLSANGTNSTIFVVMNRALFGTPGGFSVYGLGTNANTYVFRDPWNFAGNSILDIGSSSRISISNSLTGPQLYSLWRSGTSTFIFNYGASLGSNLSSSGTVGTTSQSFNIGGGIADGTYFNSFISEIVIYNYTLSNSQRQQVEAYLAWKWGLISSLTSGHPGRTFPSFSAIFTPKSISGLTLWMDAADSSTMVFSSGTTVSTWRDKSGSGNNFSRVAGTLTYTTTTTGNPGIYFPSGGAGMTSAFNAAVNGNSPRTYFFVADVPSGCRALIGTGPMQGASPPNTLGFDSAKNANTIWCPFVYTGSDITFSPLAATTTINYVAYNSAVSTLYGNYNTTTSDTTRSTTLNTSATVWYLGNRPDGNTPINSYVCEFIEFNTYLTTSQRQQVEGYLAWKWGVQSSLPTTHAFKKFKP